MAGKKIHNIHLVWLFGTEFKIEMSEAKQSDEKMMPLNYLVLPDVYSIRAYGGHRSHTITVDNTYAHRMRKWMRSMVIGILCVAKAILWWNAIVLQMNFESKLISKVFRRTKNIVWFGWIWYSIPFRSIPTNFEHLNFAWNYEIRMGAEWVADLSQTRHNIGLSNVSLYEHNHTIATKRTTDDSLSKFNSFRSFWFATQLFVSFYCLFAVDFV